jgi:tRNA threonylcarbamoyladenosine biosynthesis protein TsaB
MSHFLLHIETATPVCSVCISRDGQLIARSESRQLNTHAATLAPLIEDLFMQSCLKATDLSAVCVSEGPGSYTGLRIGMATAKGICYAVSVPLILVPTLASMAWGMMRFMSNEVVLLPALDARRNDVYYALFDRDLNEIVPANCQSAEEVNHLLECRQLKALAAGTGAEKFSPHPKNITILHEDIMDAAHMIPISYNKFLRHEFASLAYSEPMYRK